MLEIDLEVSRGWARTYQCFRFKFWICHLLPCDFGNNVIFCFLISEHSYKAPRKASQGSKWLQVSSISWSLWLFEKKKKQKKTKNQTNPWPLGFKLCLLMCLIQYRFLYEYSRRHLELAVPVILRILATYKHLLEECCKLGNPLECHRRGVNSFSIYFLKHVSH